MDDRKKLKYFKIYAHFLKFESRQKKSLVEILTELNLSTLDLRRSFPRGRLFAQFAIIRTVASAHVWCRPNLFCSTGRLICYNFNSIGRDYCKPLRWGFGSRWSSFCSWEILSKCFMSKCIKFLRKGLILNC